MSRSPMWKVGCTWHTKGPRPTLVDLGKEIKVAWSTGPTGIRTTAWTARNSSAVKRPEEIERRYCSTRLSVDAQPARVGAGAGG